MKLRIFPSQVKQFVVNLKKRGIHCENMPCKNFHTNQRLYIEGSVAISSNFLKPTADLLDLEVFSFKSYPSYKNLHPDNSHCEHDNDDQAINSLKKIKARAFKSYKKFFN